MLGSLLLYCSASLLATGLASGGLELAVFNTPPKLICFDKPLGLANILVEFDALANILASAGDSFFSSF